MSFPTWSDLNNESIVPPLGARKAPDLGPVAVMAACRPDIDLIKSTLDTPRVFPFFNNTLMTATDGDKGICVAGPFMGAPYAAMLIESLIARGVQKVIMLGWCGGLDDRLNVGDLILVNNAIVDEGTSHHYQALDSENPCTFPDAELTKSVADYFDLKNISVHQQTIWTTDAIYRETPDKIAWYKSRGAAAVEMECSALFSVARFRQTQVAAVLVVSDCLSNKGWTPGFRSKAFKKSRQVACQTVLDLVQHLETE